MESAEQSIDEISMEQRGCVSTDCVFQFPSINQYIVVDLMNKQRRVGVEFQQINLEIPKEHGEGSIENLPVYIGRAPKAFKRLRDEERKIKEKIAKRGQQAHRCPWCITRFAVGDRFAIMKHMYGKKTQRERGASESKAASNIGERSWRARRLEMRFPNVVNQKVSFSFNLNKKNNFK